MIHGSGFMVQGTGYRVQGSGFSVQGLGFRVQGQGSRVQGLGLRPCARRAVRGRRRGHLVKCFELEVDDLGFRDDDVGVVVDRV